MPRRSVQQLHSNQKVGKRRKDWIKTQTRRSSSKSSENRDLSTKCSIMSRIGQVMVSSEVSLIYVELLLISFRFRFSTAKTRSTIDRNWNTGKMKQFLIKFDMRAARAAGLPDTEEYWRFKVDPVSGWIIVTGLFGGVYAFETDGKLSWYSTLPAVPFGHLELTYSSDDNSTSYLSTTLTDRNFLIWRYHDPSKSADPESPPPTLNMSSDSLASLTPHYASLDATKRGFHPYTLLVAEDTCGATKLRYPYLLATTRDNLTAYQWNFTDPVPSRSKIDLSRAFAEPLDATENGEMEVSYVELDDDSVFVAGMRSVTIWRPEDESKDQSMVPSMSMQLANWPPLAPPGYRYLRPLVPEPLYRAVHVYNDRPFSAVHHDSKSGFLVGASHFHHFEDHACVLTLTYGYKSAIWSKDREEIEQRTMNLYLVCSVALTSFLSAADFKIVDSPRNRQESRQSRNSRSKTIERCS